MRGPHPPPPMTAVASIARSGMTAAMNSLGSAAHNIAHAGTEGFRRQTVSTTAAAGGGVGTQLEHAATPGAALERDVVSQLQSKNAFLANLAVFKTHDEMTGALLDLRA